MNFRIVATSLVAGLLSLSAIQAQDQGDSIIKTKKDAELFVPRPFRQAVPSLINDGSEALDSLETQTPGVKIVLYGNNTWKYYKDPKFILSNSVFQENWNEESADPYHATLGDLPDKISIWVVDTLSDYRCPNIKQVYSPFGYRHRHRHQGVDLPLHTGDPVYAAFSGKVRLSKWYRGYGNLVIIRHENGLETFYAHLSKREVEPGEWVEAGQQIGLGGSTGRSTGAHLHFETRFKGYAFDPQWLIDFESGTLRHRLFVLKKQYLDVNSKYVPENEDEEIEIFDADSKEYEARAEAQRIKEEQAKEAARQAAQAQYYSVRSGDTLGKIAQRHGMSLNALLKLNPNLSTRSTLRIKQRIRVK